MDARHEPLQQEILNQLISKMNDYIKDNIDELVSNKILQDQIKAICKLIYYYSKLEVDIDGILSKHNLLSTDVVFFPAISEIENQISLEDDFAKLIAMIKSIVKQDKPSNQTNAYFFQQMDHIIQQC